MPRYDIARQDAGRPRSGLQPLAQSALRMKRAEMSEAISAQIASESECPAGRGAERHGEEAYAHAE